MFFHEYGVYQLVKFRQKETEMIARNAWKYEDVKHESFFQKVVKKRTNRQKAITVQQQNCGCACQC